MPSVLGPKNPLDDARMAVLEENIYKIVNVAKDSKEAPDTTPAVQYVPAPAGSQARRSSRQVIHRRSSHTLKHH